MALITPAYVKQNFPQWDHYAAFDTAAASNDAALDNQIVNAEHELADYITVDDTTITDAIRRHLFHIVRYNLFMLQHAETEFENDPQIVIDYENTIRMLTQLREGSRPSTPPDPAGAQGITKIKAKRRRFDSWFRDNGADIVDSTDENIP